MRVYGSLNNRIAEDATPAEPKVGDGATELMYSDRRACTIIKVHGKTLTVQRDKATRADDHGMSDSQDYTYERDPNGVTATYTLRKNGRWIRAGESMRSGQVLGVGYRSEHYDYSF